MATYSLSERLHEIRPANCCSFTLSCWRIRFAGRSLLPCDRFVRTITRPPYSNHASDLGITGLQLEFCFQAVELVYLHLARMTLWMCSASLARRAAMSGPSQSAWPSGEK